MAACDRRPLIGGIRHLLGRGSTQAAIIFRVILFTTGPVFNKLFSRSFFDRENNALFSGSKIGEIPNMQAKKGRELGRK